MTALARVDPQERDFAIKTLDPLDRLIEGAESPEEFVKAHGVAKAALEYATKINLGKQTVRRINSQIFRSLYGLGKTLALTKRAPAGRKKSVPVGTDSADKAPTLAELGVQKKDGAAAARLAAAKDAEIEKANQQILDGASIAVATKTIAQAHRDKKLEEAKKNKGALSDFELMLGLGIQILPYDLWTFGACDERFGFGYPGRVPGQLVANCLYFFTEQGDTVVDPMGGSGTTVDVCKALGRVPLVFDAHPHKDRPDIKKHDMAAGWPPGTDKAALIFWDPPYFKKVDSGYGDASISRYSKDEYLAFFKMAAEKIPAGFKGKLALLCSDYNDDDPASDIWYWDYIGLFTSAGWRVVRHIQAPLSTQSVHPDIVVKFRKGKKLARLGRDLVVFERA